MICSITNVCLLLTSWAQPYDNRLAVKAKVIRTEAWIEETLPVARWLGVRLPYDNGLNRQDRCQYRSGVIPHVIAAPLHES